MKANDFLSKYMDTYAARMREISQEPSLKYLAYVDDILTKLVMSDVELNKNQQHVLEEMLDFFISKLDESNYVGTISMLYSHLLAIATFINSCYRRWSG